MPRPRSRSPQPARWMAQAPPRRWFAPSGRILVVKRAQLAARVELFAKPAGLHSSAPRARSFVRAPALSALVARPIPGAARPARSHRLLWAACSAASAQAPQAPPRALRVAGRRQRPRSPVSLAPAAPMRRSAERARARRFADRLAAVEQPRPPPPPRSRRSCRASWLFRFCRTARQASAALGRRSAPARPHYIPPSAPPGAARSSAGRSPPQMARALAPPGRSVGSRRVRRRPRNPCIPQALACPRAQQKTRASKRRATPLTKKNTAKTIGRYRTLGPAPAKCARPPGSFCRPFTMAPSLRGSRPSPRGTSPDQTRARWRKLCCAKDLALVM